MPVMALNTVVLPAPFGPMTETISLAGMSRSSALTAVKPPKGIVSCRSSRMVMTHLRFDGPRRQQTFGPEAHHQDQREAEEHVFPIAGRGEDVVGANELVRLEKVREGFEHDGIEAHDHQRAE